MMNEGDLLLTKNKVTLLRLEPGPIKYYIPGEKFFVVTQINKKINKKYKEEWVVFLLRFGYLNYFQLNKYFYTGKHLLTEKRIFIHDE